MSTDQTTDPPVGIGAAVMSLDPDGGWDHETTAGWPSGSLCRDLQAAVDRGYIEQSSAYGAACWRLTDEGMMLRCGLEKQQ